MDNEKKIRTLMYLVRNPCKVEDDRSVCFCKKACHPMRDSVRQELRRLAEASVDQDTREGFTKGVEAMLAFWFRDSQDRSSRLFEAKYLRKNIFLNPAQCVRPLHSCACTALPGPVECTRLAPLRAPPGGHALPPRVPCVRVAGVALTSPPLPFLPARLSFSACLPLSLSFSCSRSPPLSLPLSLARARSLAVFLNYPTPTPAARRLSQVLL